MQQAEQRRNDDILQIINRENAINGLYGYNPETVELRPIKINEFKALLGHLKATMEQLVYRIENHLYDPLTVDELR